MNTYEKGGGPLPRLARRFSARQPDTPKTATPSRRHWGTPQKGRVRLQERSSLYPQFSYLAEALPEQLLAILHEISP